MDLSPFPSYLHPRKVFPELQNCWAWSAQGWLVPGPLHWGFCHWVTSLFIIQASSSACCSSSFSSSSNNIPRSDLGYLSRCENCSTHFFMSIVVKAALEFQEGFSLLIPLACCLFLVLSAALRTLVSSHPAQDQQLLLPWRGDRDPCWKWNKQSESINSWVRFSLWSCPGPALCFWTSLSSVVPAAAQELQT